VPVSYYIHLDDFFVFSNSEGSLENLIANYQNGFTMSSDPAFESCKLDLSDESSLIIVGNSKRLKSIMASWFNSDLSNMSLGNYKLSAFQLIQDEGFAHFNGVVKKQKKRAVRNTIAELFNVELDADILMPPQFVTNHRSRQKDIVVQDINNSLYLISNSGKILWKEKINGPVLGKIEQIDLYRNGRLQLAFATENRVYVIDRNGNNVSPFPIKFNDKITKPLSVFDYDNNKRYRLVVTQLNKILLYDSKAQFVRGFNYSNPNEIVTQPKHFRVGSKDYIVFGAGDKMQILDRRGQLRINARNPIEFSGQDIFYYNNAFTTTSTKGELVQVRLDGSSSKQSLGLGADHFIDATSKTLVTLFENNLSIKKNTIDLDFGNYTSPKIFYINDKIYVSLTDLQTQKILMFDSQSKPIPNFPVYGNSTIDFVNMDADSNLEFVTKGESNSIIIYKKN
ncbi:MAG: ribonuclease HII, partial [Flavobacteriaceae bacterium]|nr:ribonuclease HII [Flavobacteriaceae bacterium]